MRDELAALAPLLRYPERVPPRYGSPRLDAFFDEIATLYLASLLSA
jgi:hypothetical protein